MKSQLKAKLKANSVSELIKLRAEKSHELSKTSINLKVGQEKNLHAAASIRREIAVINTFIREAK